MFRTRRSKLVLFTVRHEEIVPDAAMGGSNTASRYIRLHNVKAKSLLGVCTLTATLLKLKEPYCHIGLSGFAKTSST